MRNWILTAITVVLALPFGWGLGVVIAYVIAGKNFGQLPVGTVPLCLIASVAFALWSKVKVTTRLTVMLSGTIAFIVLARLIG